MLPIIILQICLCTVLTHGYQQYRSHLFYGPNSFSPSQRSSRQPQEAPSAPSSSNYKSYKPMPYNFNYAVKDDYTKTDYGHEESRNEDSSIVTGSYYVRLPDNRLQKVSYTVTPEDGYEATVTYEGEPEAPKPSKPQNYGPRYYPQLSPVPTSTTQKPSIEPAANIRKYTYRRITSTSPSSVQEVTTDNYSTTEATTEIPENEDVENKSYSENPKIYRYYYI